jgi:uncharacterized Rmd1/YagE family protein
VVLALIHFINLSSDILDTPDISWDMENLFLGTCSHADVARRTKVVDEKLSHCLELMKMIQPSQMNHH